MPQYLTVAQMSEISPLTVHKLKVKFLVFYEIVCASISDCSPDV